MTITTTKKYFKKKAERYDEVDKQLYWVLSDTLLWSSLKIILDTLPSSFLFLDAGGGTGRWTEKILRAYPKSNGVLYDVSENMLKVAHRKLAQFVKNGRLHIVQGDIEKSNELKRNTFDVSFNFHNVIGFVDSPARFINKLAQLTKNNRYVISFAPNYYHAIYFNISIGNIAEAKRIAATHKGTFTTEMPRIHFFTPETLRCLYEKAHLTITQLTGFPNAIYPNYQETQLSGQTTSLATLLSKRQSFNTIVRIEQSLVQNADIAARGNNIFIVGKKG